jgi:hypothetical protein
MFIKVETLHCNVSTYNGHPGSFDKISDHDNLNFLYFF